MTTAAHDVLSPDTAACIWRFEVWPAEGESDPVGERVMQQVQAVIPSVSAVHAGRVYLIQAPLDEAQARQMAEELLADPIAQRFAMGSSPIPEQGQVVEVHYKPGVMDPVAQSTRAAIAEMLPDVDSEAVQVRTGFRYDFQTTGKGRDEEYASSDFRGFSERFLANSVVQEIHLKPFVPETFPRGHRYELHLTHVDIRDLDDAGLGSLSREGHLFLSLAEMQAIQNYYREAGREPTDIELETFAQTWSEHCVHKTLKSTVRYEAAVSTQPDEDPLAIFKSPEDAERFKPGHELNEDGSVTIHNLLKRTVAAATFDLLEQDEYRDWCVSVFEDNAGIVKFDDEHGVCIKVETHNHPSAIEPYGGAATGIGGCIRDVLGTGLAAMPIANTDTFCVAPSQIKQGQLPRGVIHPKRILEQVVAGVRDYGNRMGIPTVNGMVSFHPDFLGNPLVFAGCIGLMPLDKCFGDAKVGDRIIALGGATGRDGIHGATFSSAELTDTHADEFSHAVQIGNPITQKQMLDVILQARDQADGPLFSAITDCGAGGFSSAIGEMGEKVGACVELANAPLKYAGLSYTEIWISEAQERMVLSVPPEKVERLKAMCEAEDVSFCDLGQFGYHADGPEQGEPILVLNYRDQQVGRLPMPLLHDGIPTPTREARWSPDMFLPSSTSASHSRPAPPKTVEEMLSALLGHPNIASKHWIVRQYDHEVQGGSTIKPLVGPQQDGPSDASVLRPKLGSPQAIALGCGMANNLSEKSLETGLAADGDSYWATLAAVDEAVRNVVCVGANPDRIAILDNFCFPGCDDPKQLGALVRASEGCYDAAMAYRTPFVSGKDSLNNQFTTEAGNVITIPQTLLITAMGMVEDVKRCRTMDAKQPGSVLLLVGQTTAAMGGSHLGMCFDLAGYDERIPRTDLSQGPANAQAVAKLLAGGSVLSAHDCSDGGLLVAAAEMAFAGGVGLDLDLNLAELPSDRQLNATTAFFAETPSRYLLEVSLRELDAVVRYLRDQKTPFAQVGRFEEHNRLKVRTMRDGELMNVRLQALHDLWRAPLDW